MADRLDLLALGILLCPVTTKSGTLGVGWLSGSKRELSCPVWPTNKLDSTESLPSTF